MALAYQAPAAKKTLTGTAKPPVSFKSNPGAYGMKRSKDGRLFRGLVRDIGKAVLPKGYNPKLVKPLEVIEGFRCNPLDVSAQALPFIMWVNPADLHIDYNYQRQHTSTSFALLAEIAERWNWRHYKMPNIFRMPDGRLFVVDGQTTALGALLIGITSIPVLVSDIQPHELPDIVMIQAEAFIALNTSRVQVPTPDLFTADIFKKDAASLELKGLLEKYGLSVVRLNKADKSYKTNETRVISTLKQTLLQHDPQLMSSICYVCSMAEFRPLRRQHVEAITILLKEFEAKKKHLHLPRLAEAIKSWNDAHARAQAQLDAQKNNISKPKALSRLWLERYKIKTKTNHLDAQHYAEA